MSSQFKNLQSRPPESKDIWFPAKRVGWGWGLPVAWQGWLVLAGYLMLQIGGAAILLRPHQAAGFVAYVILLTGVLIGICWLKGETPRWRGRKS